LIPKYEIANGKIQSFEITQIGQSEEHNQLRPHTIEVAFFKLTSDSLTLTKSIKVQVNPEPTTSFTEFNGLDAPDFVFINYNDHAYAKVLLDPHSLQQVKEHLHKLESPLLRQILLSTLHRILTIC
jgi:aminopeptidase N